MKQQCRLLATAAALGVFALGAALAQSGQSGKAGTTGQTGHEAQPGHDQTMSEAERSGAKGSANRLTGSSTFVMKAAHGGMAEVELGQLATERASDASVKDFGQRMVTDHSKANDELKQIASSKGINLPTTLDAKNQATKDRLSKLNGAAFDRAYMQDMVNDHREDVNEFRRESQRGTDPEVKAFAAKTLPTLEEHLKLAESTLAKVKK
jgi:putative membrane protein